MTSLHLLLLTVIITTAVVVGLTQYITHSRAIKAVETKAVHLKCAVCGLLVARYQQGHDLVIRCVNCLRAIEKKL